MGTFLFQDNSIEIKRSRLEFSYQSHPRCPNKQQLWARRSIFESQGESLNLQEVFLPTLFDFIGDDVASIATSTSSS